MVWDFLFKSSDHEFLTSHQVSFSRPALSAHSEHGKMAESKTEKKKTMSVKKVVEALGDSWQGHPTTVSS